MECEIVLCVLGKDGENTTSKAMLLLVLKFTKHKCTEYCILNFSSTLLLKSSTILTRNMFTLNHVQHSTCGYITTFHDTKLHTGSENWTGVLLKSLGCQKWGCGLRASPNQPPLIIVSLEPFLSLSITITGEMSIIGVWMDQPPSLWKILTALCTYCTINA